MTFLASTLNTYQFPFGADRPSTLADAFSSGIGSTLADAFSSGIGSTLNTYQFPFGADRPSTLADAFSSGIRSTLNTYQFPFGADRPSTLADAFSSGIRSTLADAFSSGIGSTLNTYQFPFGADRPSTLADHHLLFDPAHLTAAGGYPDDIPPWLSQKMTPQSSLSAREPAIWLALIAFEITFLALAAGMKLDPEVAALCQTYGAQPFPVAAWVGGLVYAMTMCLKRDRG